MMAWSSFCILMVSSMQERLLTGFANSHEILKVECIGRVGTAMMSEDDVIKPDDAHQDLPRYVPSTV